MLTDFGYDLLGTLERCRPRIHETYNTNRIVFGFNGMNACKFYHICEYNEFFVILFFSQQMVATKFYSGHDDEAPYVNWTECINTTSDDLLQMELSFLNAIDWKVYVSNEEFFEKVRILEITLAQQQGMKRGFYTYLELSSIMPSVQIANEFIQSMLVMSLSYTVLVATMVASVFLASQIPGTYLNASSRTSATQSSTQLSSSGNSSFQQQIETNEVTNILSTTNGLIESTNDLNVLINLALDRLNETPVPVNTPEQPNKTTRTSSLYSTWYSLLQIDSFKWPVIRSNWDSTCDYGISQFFCNSSARDDLLSSQPKADRFKFDFNGIKIEWA